MFSLVLTVLLNEHSLLLSFNALDSHLDESQWDHAG